MPGSGTTGTWIDETDIRPTVLYLAGLRDDYVQDGRVITQIVRDPNRALSEDDVSQLGACYKQLNSSVGEFGTDTLIADTNAVESTSTGDQTYLNTVSELRWLEVARDNLAGTIKAELNAAAFGDQRIRHVDDQVDACKEIVRDARRLAS